MEDGSIAAATGYLPGSADAGADRGAGHGPLEPDAAPVGEPAPGGHETKGGTMAVYRTPAGWRVGDEELPDLVSAMVFADLLANDLPSPARPATDRGEPGAVDTDTDTDTARLKMTIAQLEHALAHRVRVEQAIGVLTERHRLPPRQSFEMLRTAARSRGRRVHELADEVLANVTNPLLPVAEELARPQAPRRGRSRSRA
jgi:ANTAR domain